jgi:hypothetical protein
MTNERGFSVEDARPEHARAIAELFEREGCACFCRWWHFEGDKNAWLGGGSRTRRAKIAKKCWQRSPPAPTRCAAWWRSPASGRSAG